MGKQKKALATSLDYGERQELKKAIKSKCSQYQKTVNDKYHDGFENSIMMSPDDTVMKNEILRKIKYEKMKKAKLSNFVRIERERIMSRRTSTNVNEVQKTTTSQRSDSYDDSI